ncbi:MAG TPA: HAMP domain-containing sensor histidine kinase [Ktedonobacterales bacterium]
MIEKSLITRTEREIYVGYDRERRLQMLRTITPVFMAICAVVAVMLAASSLVIPSSVVPRSALLVTAIMLACCIVTLWLGLLAVRREQLNLATAFVAGTSALGTSASLAIWSAYLGLDPFAIVELTPFSVVIVLAGLLGNVRWIVLAAVVMNVATVVLLLLLPVLPGHPGVVDSTLRHELLLILPVALVHQWLFAVLMITIWRLFQRTLGAVGVAYERAQQLDVLKDEFIASVNHELRTPLMTMQTYLETLRERPDLLPPDQLAYTLDHVCRVGDSLIELVQGILSSREIDRDSGTFTSEPVAVRAALDAAILLIDPRTGDVAAEGTRLSDSAHPLRDLVVDVPETLVVWGERVRLQQVLTNLLSNAVKYSPPGTPIEARAFLKELPVAAGRARWQRGARHVPALVEITIRDFGHGIPPDQAPLLFNRFVRLPRDLASKVQGTGLGLYLCRVLAESMGGRIWVESTGVDGEGSTFHLTLPVPSISARRLGPPHAQVAAM